MTIAADVGPKLTAQRAADQAVYDAVEKLLAFLRRPGVKSYAAAHERHREVAEALLLDNERRAQLCSALGIQHTQIRLGNTAEDVVGMILDGSAQPAGSIRIGSLNIDLGEGVKRA